MQADNTNPVPFSLEAVRSYAERVQPEVAAYEDELFGRFRITPNIAFNRDNPHFNYETEDGLYVKVDLDMSPTIVQISTIHLMTRGEWWSVDRFNIICRTDPQHERQITFPAWELRWGHDKARPERMGRLEHVAFSFAEHQGVFYNFEGRDEVCRPYGCDAEAMGFPKSISGLEEFQGRKLQWNLDTKAMEEEIINRSAIFELLVSVPFR